MQSLQALLTQNPSKVTKFLIEVNVLKQQVETHDLKQNFSKFRNTPLKTNMKIGKYPCWIGHVGNTSSNGGLSIVMLVFRGKSKTIKLCQQLPGTPVFNRLSAGTTSPVPRTTMSPRTTVLVVIWTSFLKQTILGNLLPSEIAGLKAQVFFRDSSWSSDVVKDP